VNIFVAKYNSNGYLSWRNKLSSTGSDINYNLYCDSSDSVYLVGTFTTGTLRMYNISGINTMSITSATVNNCGFIAKLDLNGEPLWITKIDSLDTSIPYSITSDNTNIYVVGKYTSSSVLTFYNSDGTTYATTLPSNTNEGGFICSYDSTGIVNWITGVYGNGNTSIVNITYYENYLYMIGNFDNSTSFYNVNISSIYTTITNTDTASMLFCYDVSGNTLWVTYILTIGIPTTSSIFGIDAINEKIIITGNFTGDTMLFYNSGLPPIYSSISIANTDKVTAYICSYNLYGWVNWASKITSTDANILLYKNSVVDSYNYVIGYTDGTTINFYDKNNNITNTLTNDNPSKMMAILSKYDDEGTIINVTKYKSTSSDCYGYDLSQYVGVEYTCGDYGQNLDIYESSGALSSINLSGNNNNSNVYLVKGSSGNLVIGTLTNQGINGFMKTISSVNLNGMNAYIYVFNLLYLGVQKYFLIFTEDAQNIILMWNGTYWTVVSNNGVLIQ
jgi:hypothetical protein